MEVQLRPAKLRTHPLLRRRGMGFIQPPDCTPRTPGAIPDPACIAEQSRIQQLNMAEHDEGQRQIFLDNCNRDWALNDAQYAAMGLPRPVNQCESIYPASGRGAANPVQIQPVYMAPEPVRVVQPAQVAAPTVAIPAQQPGVTVTRAPDIGTPPGAPTPAGQQQAAPARSQTVTEMVEGAFSNDGVGIPTGWYVIGALAVLYFMTKGK